MYFSGRLPLQKIAQLNLIESNVLPFVLSRGTARRLVLTATGIAFWVKIVPLLEITFFKKTRLIKVDCL